MALLPPLPTRGSGVGRKFVLISLAALTGGLTAVAAAAVPAHAAPSTSDAQDQASRTARSAGRPVDVPSLTTETQTVVANPDGTFTARITDGPTRFKSSAGAWVEIDMTLVRHADGTIAPRGNPHDLVLPGAVGEGSHDLARMTVSGHEIALGWQGALPEPVLDGSQATYPDVRAGTDLVIRATRAGFEEFVVAKDRAALTAAQDLTFGWRTDGLTARGAAEGATDLVAADGTAVARIPVARMWDARTTRAGDPAASAKVHVAVHRPQTRGVSKDVSGLRVTADSAFVKDPKLKFPVTIDPTVVTLSKGFDAFVQNSYSSDQSGSEDLKLGYSDDGGKFTARSYLRYDGLSGYASTSVQSAVLYLYNYHSWSCTAASWEAWRVSWADSSLRWTKQPTWQAKVGTSTVTKGYNSSCGDGWVTVNVAGALQYAFDNSKASAAIGLKATSETNHNGWKKFQSAQGDNPPYVSLTYNRKPGTPSGLTAQGKSCASGMLISTTTGQPKLQAKVSDPDGDTLSAKFYIAQVGTALPANPTVSVNATSGTVATVTVPTSVSFVEGRSYTWQVMASDASSSGPRASCTFKVDNGTMQKAPTVVSDGVYPENGSGGAAGVSGKFTFGPNGVTTVDRYQYRFIYRGTTYSWKETTVTAGASTTITWSPPFDEDATGGPIPVDEMNMGGQVQLDVRMGNPTLGWFNNVETFTSQVRSAAGETAHWKMDDPDGATQLTDETDRSETKPLGARPATPSNLVRSGEHRGDYGGSWQFDGSTGYAQAASPLTAAPGQANTTSSFSVSVWARLADKDTDHAVVSAFDSRGETFAIKYDKSSDTWWFGAGDTDAEGVASTTAPKIGVWTQLSGAYDSGTGRLRMYVDGREEGHEVTVRTEYNAADERVYLGRGASSYWHGEIDDVRMWNRVIDPREAAALASVESASWSLDNSLVSGMSSPFEPFDLTAYDANGPADITSDVTLPAQAAWWSPVGHTTGDGGSIQLTAAGPQWLEFRPTTQDGVARTGSSFTVSAWLHLDAIPTGAEGTTFAAVGQDGACRSAFVLGAKIVSGKANWYFGLPDHDAAAGGDCDTAGTAAAVTPIAAAQVGKVGADEEATDVWAQLVGVYDATAGQVRLYVNGQESSVVSRSARWSAPGAITVGRAQRPGSATADFFKGRVDAVRVSQGVQPFDAVVRSFQLDGGVPARTVTEVPIVAATGSATCAATEVAANVFDRDPATKFCTKVATGQYLQVQTAAAVPLTSVMIYHSGSTPEWQESWDLKDYDILTSANGTTWTTSLQVRGNTAGTSRHTFPAPVTAKYVKINVITPTQSTDTAARIYEVRLFKGTKVPFTSAVATDTAHSCTTTETADKLADGNVLGTKYCGWARDFRLDLGAAKTINSVVLWHCLAGNEHPSWNTVAYEIYGSLDGLNWNVLAQEPSNVDPVGVHDLRYSVNTRYIRVHVSWPAADEFNYTRLFEIEAYQ